MTKNIPEKLYLMRMINVIFFGSLVLMLCSDLRAEEIVDERFGFAFDVPDGFSEFAIDAADHDSLYQFVDREPTPDDIATVIQVQRLRGTIDPNERLSPKHFPDIAGTTTTVQEGNWNGLTIDISRQVMFLGEVEFVVYSAQFPLPAEAVQLQVGGPAAREDQTKQLFDEAVASFTSNRPIAVNGSLNSHKLSDPERQSRFLSGIFRLSVTFLVIAAIVGYFGKKIRQRKRRRELNQPHSPDQVS